jgi:hypothetical protein
MTPVWWHWQGLLELEVILVRREPLITAGVITSLIASALTLLKAFGVDLTADQQAAINQFVAILAPISVVVIGRMFVTPIADPRNGNGDPLYSYQDALDAVQQRGQRG